MALLALTGSITIGNYTFDSVNEVQIERSIHSYEQKATIKLPSISRLLRKLATEPEELTTAQLFNEGDPVTIKLGYNDNLETEFIGFVKRRTIGIPIEIECEGYSYLLRKNTHKADLSVGIGVKELLAMVTKGTDITFDCGIDFKIFGRHLTGADGCEVLDEIVKCSDKALSLFFIEPKKLWCGLVYKEVMDGSNVFNLPEVQYRLGFNCPQENELKERQPKEHVDVIVNGRLANGDHVRTKSDDKKDARKAKHLFNGVQDTDTLTKFAKEKANRANYEGYEGSFTGFLVPVCKPGYSAFITDDRYPERDGTYLVESVTTTFGSSGGRRRIEIGLKSKIKK
jgi:hypothetical protein